MQTNHHYARLGGLFLEYPEVHVFVNPKSATWGSDLEIVHVDADRFDKLWKDKADKAFPPPPANEEWEETKRRIVWRFLEGPKHPIKIPQICFSDDGLIVGASSAQLLKLILEWEAAVFPVLVAPDHVGKIKELAGNEDIPIIQGPEFLGDSQRVILAFQENISLAGLFAGEKVKDEDQDRVRQSAEDYAHLIHFQLEILQVRSALYQNNTTLVTDDQRSALLNEVRGLLAQKEIITHFLSKGADPKNIPTWSPGDMESKATAAQFLAKNATGSWNGTHLQDMYSGGAANDEEVTHKFVERDRARRHYGVNPSRPRPPHLRLITNGSDEPT